MQVTSCPSPDKALPIALRIKFSSPAARGALCDLSPALPDLILTPRHPGLLSVPPAPGLIPSLGLFRAVLSSFRDQLPCHLLREAPSLASLAGLALSPSFLALPQPACACSLRVSSSRAPSHPPTQPLEKRKVTQRLARHGVSTVCVKCTNEASCPATCWVPRCPEPLSENL